MIMIKMRIFLNNIAPMSRILFYVINFIITAQFVYPQTSFEINLPFDNEVTSIDGIEMPDGDFVFIINSYTEVPRCRQPYIVKCSTDGQVISLLPVDFDDCIYLRKIMFDESTSQFIIFGTFSSIQDIVYDSIVVSIWSQDFELINLIKIPGPFQEDIFWGDVFQNNSNQFILAGFKFYPTNYGFIYILDNQFSLINQKVFDYSSIINSVSEFGNADASGYLFTLSGRPPGFTQYGEYLLKTDLALDLIGYYPTHIIFGFGMTSIVQYNEDTFILAGKYNLPGQTRDVGVEKIDHNNNLIVWNVFGMQADTIDFPAHFNGVAVVNADTIYIPGSANIDPVGYPYSHFLSWFMLNKVDGDLNLHWQRFYGGNAYYLLTSIIATSDGGCVMMGTRYHPDNPTGIDAYILKVGPDGLVSVPEVEGGLQVREVILYPNPGTSQLYIQTGHDDLEIRLYTANGSLHFKDRINQFSHTVNTASWPAGTYLYQIAKGVEIMDSGKWIKAE